MLLFKSEDGPLVGDFLMLSCGIQQQGAFVLACAARMWFDKYVHTQCNLGSIGAISYCCWLALAMGNEMEVENSVSRRGYNWQALPLAHMQKSVRFNWACTKVNRLWFLGGKLHLFPSWFMCKLGTFALGQGGWLEIGATSLVWLLPTATNLSETWCEFWCLRKELPQSWRSSCLQPSDAP